MSTSIQQYVVALDHDDWMRVMEWGWYFSQNVDPESFAATAVLKRTPGLEEDIRKQLQDQG